MNALPVLPALARRLGPHLAPLLAPLLATAALLALAALSVLLALPALAADRAGAADATRTLSPYFAVEGGEPGVDSLPLKSTRADVAISGVIADVRITQVYRNEGAVPLAARYVFPASTRAAVHALRLRVGSRAVDAEIREKQQARAEFAQAKREGKSAALLEQNRPNVFTMAVANVMPGDEIAVELRYSELIVPDEGRYRFVFPTVVGPRYNGGGATAPVFVGDGEDRDMPADARADGRGAPRPANGAANAATESHRPEGWIAQPFLRDGRPAPHTFELHATLQAPLPIAALASPSHPVVFDGVGTQRASFTLPAAAAHADRDLVIDYRLAGQEIAAGLLVHEGADENTFLLMAQPPARVAAAAVLPRDYVFVVDVSGSMHGFPLDVAKALLRDLIGRLRPGDTFNVIPFAGGSSLLAPASLPASEENIARALRFIDGQTGGGGTELLPALRRALALPTDAGRARSFVVVTDGYVTIEKEAFDLVRSQLGRANLFAFGIGSSVNRHLIEGLARAGQGEPFFVLDASQAAAEATRLRKYIEQPLLTRIAVRFPDAMQAYDLDTPQLPDLFAQRPLLLLGKYKGRLTGSVEIEGIAAGGRQTLAIDLAQARAAAQGSAPASALALLWARSRVAQLGDTTRLAGDSAAKHEILALGLKYRLLTDYTSFIAVDHVIRNPGAAGADVDQPSPLPQGVSEKAVGAEMTAAPATPEPEFALLAALAGGMTLWLRRRAQRRAEGGRA